MKRSRAEQRGDNQVDRARVLEVRIHSPPAKSQQQTRFRHFRHGDFRGARNAAAPGSDGTLGVGHDPLDERKKIDNSALRCYKSTNTTCIFIDSGLPDIADLQGVSSQIRVFRILI